jgi:hypothetical protein
MTRSGTSAGTGTEITRFNALRHGVLSRYTVLPWEDTAEYETLVGSLVAEHQPEGPTEEHLVEELAGIIWRKRRLRQAEGAAHRRGLEDALSFSQETAKAALAYFEAAKESIDVAEAIRATAEDTEDDLRDVQDDASITKRALGLLGSRRNDAYEAAVAALREDTREWWRDVLTASPDELEEGDEAATADAAGLRRFLEGKVLPWFEDRKRELENRPLIRDQVIGESLNPDRLERLGRYEVHLDRKLERMLAMLLRLKDLRRGVIPA